MHRGVPLKLRYRVRNRKNELMSDEAVADAQPVTSECRYFK